MNAIYAAFRASAALQQARGRTVWLQLGWLYLDTIDQLLGYLTWRENYGVMITFSRRKEFSKVLEQIPGVTQRHASYAKGFRGLATSHFVSVHTLPGDKGKEVELHHLLYNLYAE